MFICTDNTIKEAKNYYFLGFLQYLVDGGYIKDALYYNLALGHTHFEVDQSIGLDKRFWYRKNIETMDDLIDQLNSRRNGWSVSVHLTYAETGGQRLRSSCDHFKVSRRSRFSITEVSVVDPLILEHLNHHGVLNHHHMSP